MFKKGEIVLAGSDGKYLIRKVQTVYADGCDLIEGYYASKYSNRHIHKCPASIKKAEKEQ